MGHLKEINCTNTGDLLAIYASREYLENSKDIVNFISKSHLELQIFFMHRENGQDVQGHHYKTFERKIFRTTEVLYLLPGSANLKLWALNSDGATNSQDVQLYEGDLIYLFSGCHSISFSETTRLFEIKQGPFFEDQDKVILS